MKYTVFMSLIVMILIHFTANSQEVIDTTYLYCQYDAKTIKLSAQKKMTDMIRLEIGHKHSKSYSYYTEQYDSFTCVPDYLEQIKHAARKADKSQPDWVENTFSVFPKMKETAIVYKNHSLGTLSVFDRINNIEYEYKDKLNDQSWKIMSDTTIVLGYNCTKAECNWRGRTWIAYFTADIPVSDGPLKFGGLPGLIMKIYSEDGEWNYEISGLQYVKKVITRRKPLQQNKYKKTDRKKFLRATKNFLNNLGIYYDMTTDTPLGIKAGAGDRYDLMERDY